MRLTSEALAGRVTIGRARNGSGHEDLTLRLKRQTVYELQQYLEERTEKSDNRFEIRELVLWNEELKQAVVEYEAGEPLQGGAGGE